MSNTVATSGGCACGGIRYDYSGDPVLSLNCHCRDCQQATGSAFAPLIVVLKDTFRLVSGAPKYHAKISDAGTILERGFCPDCGSRLTILEPARPKLVFVNAASLDDPSVFQPSMDIFTQSAHPWDVMNPELEKYSKMPPVPDDLGR